DQDGEQVDLASYRGRKVVVYFYPKDDTPGCTTEACQFNDGLSAFEGQGVDVVGISADDAESHRRFRGKYGLQFKLLSDADHRVADSYGAYGDMTFAGKTFTGILRSTFLVDEEGRIQQAWYEVKPDGHPAAILQEVGARA
ncbi:MAG: thioredoxin-dependent thiol peroxidase, partial [Candidatus Dormibacteraeota bacterium]|nr:thioredoxin-dependent thiol peroxidase [Candidatus Dormibacteraeota bacterium]